MQGPFLIRWFVALTAWWLSTGASGASESVLKPATREGTAKLRQDWNLQSAQAIRDAKRSNLPSKGGLYPGQVRILKDLIDAAPVDVVEAEFQRICASAVPKSYAHGAAVDKNYDYVLLIALVERSIERKDAAHLTTLLSHHCPREVVYCPLEFALAYRWPGSIERLIDCYSAARSPSAKEDILFCLGRAFPALRDRFSASTEFVNQARSWYVANQGRLKVNDKYQYIPSLPPPSAGEDRTNLFLYGSK
jgi:hypothetical protein